MAVKDDEADSTSGYLAHLDRVDRLDSLLLQLLFYTSAAGALARLDLGNAGLLARARDTSSKLEALAPLLVHLVTYGRQHLAELAAAMADDPRAAHLFEASTTSPPEGPPPSAKH